MQRKNSKKTNTRKQVSFKFDSSSDEEPEEPRVPGLEAFRVKPEMKDDIDSDDPDEQREMEALYAEFRDSREYDKKLQHIMTRSNRGKRLMAKDKKEAFRNFRVAATLLRNFNVKLHSEYEMERLEVVLVELHTFMMRMYNETKNFGKTIATARSAVKYAPNTAYCTWEFLLLWGDALDHLGKLNKAEATYKAAYKMAQETMERKSIGERITYVQMKRESLNNPEMKNKMPLIEPKNTDRILDKKNKAVEKDFQRMMTELTNHFERWNMKKVEVDAYISLEKTKEKDNNREYVKGDNIFKRNYNIEKTKGKELKDGDNIVGASNYNIEKNENKQPFTDEEYITGASNYNIEKNKEKQYKKDKFIADGSNYDILEDISKAFEMLEKGDIEIMAKIVLDNEKTKDQFKNKDDIAGPSNYNTEKKEDKQQFTGEEFSAGASKCNIEKNKDEKSKDDECIATASNDNFFKDITKAFEMLQIGDTEILAHIELENKKTKDKVKSKDDIAGPSIEIEKKEDKQLNLNLKIEDKEIQIIKGARNINIKKSKFKQLKDNENNEKYVAGPSNYNTKNKQFKDTESNEVDLDREYERIKSLHLKDDNVITAIMKIRDEKDEITRKAMELKIIKCQHEKGDGFQKFIEKEFVEHLHKIVADQLAEYMKDYDKRNKTSKKKLSNKKKNKQEKARNEFYVMAKDMLECEKKKILVTHRNMIENVEKSMKIRKDLESKKN